MLYILRAAAGILQQGIGIITHFLTGNYLQEISKSDSKPRTMKNIVILGGSYAGISTAHRILKQAGKLESFKVTLVSQNTHFYWNMASPRGIFPGQFTDDDLFRPIAPGFAKYPARKFELIIGTAETLDFAAKTVGITGSTGSTTISYDFLILATGSRTRESTPFKGLGSTDATKKSLHDFQARVKKAETIVVAGGGVTGVEVAGELASEYGQSKDIILIANSPTLLAQSPAFISKFAVKELQNLKVDIRFQTKVSGSIELPDGRQELTFSDGSKQITDMYIPTFGLVANSSYIPAKFLKPNGSVIVDPYLKVKGLNDAWAIGDITDIEPSQFIYCDKQSTYVAKSIVLTLNNKTPQPYKAATTRMMGFQIGRKTGTGHYGNMKIPTFVIVWARKALFLNHMGPTIDGSQF